MYCKECGTKNEKNAKFCSNCGKEITEESKKTTEEDKKITEENKKTTEESKKVTPVTNNSTVDTGGIRKAMKKEAKNHVNGHLIGATAIYLVVCGILGGLLSPKVVYDGSEHVTYSVTSALPGILTALIGVLFTYGIIMVSFKAVKGEKFEFSDVFLKPFENMKFLGYVILLSVIVGAISTVLAIIPILGWIALIVGYFYYTPAISTFIILLADSKTNKDISFTDAAKKSLELVKGNRIEYYGVTFSFIGWILLSVLTCGILFIWLIPYMELTYVNLYNKWTKEKEFKASETGLSNSTVVGITAGSMGCGCLIVAIIAVIAFGTLIGIISSHIDDPQIKSFIDKYSHNRNINDNDLEKDINDIINSYNSNYNN